MPDTTGVGTPGGTFQLYSKLLETIPPERLAMHFHDTYGQALANIVVGLQMGLSVIDSSVAGLGGCPFAPGATGNVATEDALYMLKGMGIETGVNLEKMVEIGHNISALLGRKSHSRAAVAIAAKRPKECV